MRTLKNVSLSLALAATIAVTSLAAAALPASADDATPAAATTPSDPTGATSDTTQPIDAVPLHL